MSGANRPTMNDTPVITTGTGTVKWFDASKGFGLVTPDTGMQRNLFVHINTVRSAGLAETLVVGQAVSYTLSTSRGRGLITELALKNPEPAQTNPGS
jgi:CspA family cold shock protein